MINQFEDLFLKPLAGMAGFFVLILGAMWLIYAVYEAKRRGSVKERKVEDWDFKLTKFLKFLTYIGFFVGIFAILSGVGGLMYDIPPSNNFFTPHVSIFTSALLIILGILTFLKPLNDLPIATIIGLLAGTAVVTIIVIALPEKAYEIIGIFMNPKVFFVILFIIIFAIISLTAKFYIGGLMAISKFISWPPIAFIVAGFCFLQAVLILGFGVSITGLF
ncbi:MAG: hypothetical protein ACFE9R_05085 [Candidatus Hermodarchaeota archaeon]